MSSLTGQKIKDTYQSLLKTNDNGLVTNAFKNITDGSGSASGLYLKNNGVLLSGSVDISGSLNAISITGSLQGTSSFAISASWAPNNIDIGSLVTTSSFNNFTSSYNTGSFSGSFEGTASFAISASWAPTSVATPGGSNTQIQFNSGSRFNGSAYFKFNYASQSLEQGSNTITRDFYSHAEGENTIAGGFGSHAEGFMSYASGAYSHAEGDNTQALGIFSHTEGNLTTTQGNYSHAEGYSTEALGEYSHAEGRFSRAIGQSSHAEGFSTQTLGNFSHTEGELCIALGAYSHAEGGSTATLGAYSHAEGDNTVSLGAYSHAEGYYTIASGSAQHVSGKFNEHNNDSSIFVVGIGLDGTSRKDGFTVDVDANGSGSIMIPQNNTDLVDGFPTNPKVGSMLLDPINEYLWIYTGVNWKYTPLQAITP